MEYQQAQIHSAEDVPMMKTAEMTAMVACEDDVKNRYAEVSKSEENESCLKSGSRMVPFLENDNCESDMVNNNVTKEVNGNHEEVEDLYSIRKQLVQIENQQSSLLDLLQLWRRRLRWLCQLWRPGFASSALEARSSEVQVLESTAM
ncbi:hypothetical protein F0562_017860 [Nyssa sinensis]|uniref:Uncharacterized protein n=1 Tax=Nyssa sinensis TaxID=561372 RepID=A0A5J4ZG56_9ASTE|nr:hypothetical protein F0562_017860 [Nyssa sinensis]